MKGAGTNSYYAVLILIFITFFSFSVEGQRKIKSTTVFSLNGEAVNITCQARNTFVQAHGRYSEIKWFNRNHKEIQSDSEHYQVDAMGKININPANANDNGLHTCLVNSVDDQKGDISVHPLIVYELPEYYYRTILQYTVPDCNDDSQENYHTYLYNKVCPQDVKVCPYLYTQKCITITSATKNSEQKHHIRVTFKVSPQNSRTEFGQTCRGLTNYCFNRITKHIQNNISPLIQHLLNQLETEFDQLTVVENSTDIVCGAGFTPVRNSICLPCKPGTYGLKGNIFCENCPMNFYQDQYGANRCIHCPSGRGTKFKGTITKAQCITGIGNDNQLSHAEPESLGSKSLDTDNDNADSENGLPVGVIVAIFLIALFLIMTSIFVCCFLCKKRSDVAKQKTGDHNQESDSDREHERKLARRHRKKFDHDHSRSASEIQSLLEEEGLAHNHKKSHHHSRHKKRKHLNKTIKEWQKKMFERPKKNKKKLHDSDVNDEEDEDLKIEPKNVRDTLHEILDMENQQQDQENPRIYSDLSVVRESGHAGSTAHATNIVDGPNVMKDNISATGSALFSDAPWMIGTDKTQADKQREHVQQQHKQLSSVKSATAKPSIDLTALFGN